MMETTTTPMEKPPQHPDTPPTTVTSPGMLYPESSNRGKTPTPIAESALNQDVGEMIPEELGNDDVQEIQPPTNRSIPGAETITIHHHHFFCPIFSSSTPLLIKSPISHFVFPFSLSLSLSTMSHQPWFTDSSTAAGSTHPTRPSYLPPHLRTQQPNIPSNVADHDHHPLDMSQKLKELEITTNNSSEFKEVEATGVDIPAPVASFWEMEFASKTLADNIRRCKYVHPTPIQRYAIPVAMAGRDFMACAQTGSGKTAAFCFPIINAIMMVLYKQQQRRQSSSSSKRFYGYSAAACPMALILAPTRELASQIYEEAKKFSYQTGVNVVVAYGGAPIIQQLRNLEKGVDILVATPGRLVDMIERAKVSLRNVKYLALDEADRMLDMGFERQVRKIVQQMGMPPPGARQTMLFSATFPDEIQRLASDFLSNYIFLAAGKVGSSTNLIVQRVEFVPDMDKREHLVNLLRSHKTTNTTAKDVLTLVFVETKRGADSLESWLSRKGFPSTAIHGDKVQMERERALKSFRNGVTPILVATDVAARGLDIPNVAHVINFDLPRAVDDYVHRIGRTGRAGKSGLATAFFNDKNAPIAKSLVELMQEANQEIPTWLTEYVNNNTSIPSSGYGGGTKTDYRSSGGFGGGYGDYYDACGPPPPVTSYGYPYDYSAANGGSSYSYGPIIATGWD
ncbi:hypothetical protein BUALT_Bualt12G0098000 [Buddleja alternifolia]|uniref:RNA helicase n=1 Tax=Buddleja alternifolia TaxID=168488 RepID=A0AAV6WRB4_9LAMI|nr:hypothetical protein BUALT_Bualt12G0098000 [Buddleja alternifolia]